MTRRNGWLSAGAVALALAAAGCSWSAEDDDASAAERRSSYEAHYDANVGWVWERRGREVLGVTKYEIDANAGVLRRRFFPVEK